MSLINFSEDELMKIQKRNPKNKTIKDLQSSNQHNVIANDELDNQNSVPSSPDTTSLIKADKARVFSMDSLAPVKPKKKRTTPIQTNLTRAGTITREINSIDVHVKFNENYFSILFVNGKLLTVNDLFTLLQSPKKQGVVWGYKKAWHKRIRQIIENELAEAKKENKKLPYFDGTVELTLLRQAPTLVDKDAFTTMFKYIIDGLRYHKTENPLGILSEDNPNIVDSIRCESLKGGTRADDNYVGIRIKKTTKNIVAFSPFDILEENT